MDGGHVPYLGAIAALFFYAQRSGRLVTRATRAVAAIFLWAGLVELIQPAFGRTASWSDFGNGLLGATLAACILVCGHRHWWKRMLLFCLLSAVAMFWRFFPALEEWDAIRLRQRQFPMLGDFESGAELRFWVAPESGNTRLQRVPMHAISGKNSLSVSVIGPGWPGVRYLAEDQDWSAFSTLIFDVYNPGEPFHLAVRIDDVESTSLRDRFDGSYRIASGANHIRIPLAKASSQPAGRPLNLGTIRRVVFFTENLPPGQSYFLDAVRLEAAPFQTQ